jgi:predicted AAA+ superfamily ATPase
MTCQSEFSFADAKKDHAYWGRLVESAAGAHLVNESDTQAVRVFYWREGEKEVDFVVQHGNSLTAIEVKSVPRRGALSGMEEFAKKFKPRRKLLVGGDGIPVEEFLEKSIMNWIK